MQNASDSDSSTHSTSVPCASRLVSITILLVSGRSPDKFESSIKPAMTILRCPKPAKDRQLNEYTFSKQTRLSNLYMSGASSGDPAKVFLAKRLNFFGEQEDG